MAKEINTFKLVPTKVSKVLKESSPGIGEKDVIPATNKMTFRNYFDLKVNISLAGKPSLIDSGYLFRALRSRYTDASWRIACDGILSWPVGGLRY